MAYKFSSEKFKSIDDGLSWTQGANFFHPGNITHVSNQNDEFLSTWSTNLAGTLIGFNQNLATTNIIEINAVKTFNNGLIKSYYLPNNDIITFNNGLFMKVDTATNNVYYYDHNLVDPSNGDLVQTIDFDIDQTYGIAVGKYGGLSRFDLNQPEELYIPADFTLIGSTCPGDTIYAEPAFDYADSVQWVFDDNIISTDNYLAYETPYQFGTFDLVHHTWYKGIVRSDTQQVYFEPLYPATPYYFGNIDTMPCFQSPTGIAIHAPGTSNYNGALEIWFNDQMLDSIHPQPTSTFSFWSPIINSQDTIYMISKHKQQCGTTTDSSHIILYPGDDLSDDFQLVTGNDSICIWDTVKVQLMGTKLGNTYDFVITNDFNTTVSTLSYPGTGADTMNVMGPTGITESNIFNNNTNYFVELIVKNSQGNCQTASIYLDTIVCTNPRSLFYLHSKNYYRKDTVKITNVTIKQNRIWDVTPGELTAHNITDTVPAIFGDTTGVYEISLTNTPLAGCTSASKKWVTYADSMETLTKSVCAEEPGESRHSLMLVKLDNQGNIFELGIHNGNVGVGSGRPAFHLTKRDQNNQFLWQQKATTFGFDIKGVVIEDIDFDVNGDVYAALWIEGSSSYHHDLISYYPTSYTNKRKGYIVKFDGQTGDMIWVRDLMDYPINVATSSTVTASWRIMSLVVTSTEIHFTVGTNTSINVVSTTLGGDYINTFHLGSFIMPTNMLVYTGATAGSHQSTHSPRLMEMSNGEILGVAHYSKRLNNHGNNIPEMYSMGKDAIMAFKYNSQDGMYGFKKLASMDNSDAFIVSGDGIPKFDLDKNDNLTIGFTRRLQGDTLKIVDSLIISPEGTHVFQVDKDFNLRWITSANYTTLSSVAVANETGDVFISGITRDNIAISNGNSHKMLGSYSQYETEYGTPFHFWELATYQYRKDSPFIIHLDSIGTSKGGLFFNDQNAKTNCTSNVTNKIDVTPCGDIVNVMNLACSSNGTASFIEENTGLIMEVNSSKTSIFRSDCFDEACTVFDFGYDTLSYCSFDDSLFVPLNSNSYNIDSITYELIENGTALNSQTIFANDIGFHITLPNINSDFSLRITSPVLDSISIIISNQIAAVYSYDSLMCWGEIQVITGTPATNEYSWKNDSLLGQNLVFNDSLYSIGINYLNVISTDINGCKLYDTMTIEVHKNITTYLHDSIMCWGDSQILSGTPTNQNYVWNNTPSLEPNLSFDDTFYNPGLNLINVVSTDINGCEALDTLKIWVNDPIPPNFSSNYDVPCLETISLPIQSSNYLDQEWLQNGNASSNYFSNDNLNEGINNISITLTDIKECIKQYATTINYCYDLGTEAYNKKKVEVIPNPSSGKFEIRFTGFNESGRLSFYSSEGRLILEKDVLLENNLHLNVDTTPGVYWLKIQTKHSIIQRKVIIN